MSALGEKILLMFAPKTSREAFGIPDLPLPVKPEVVRRLQAERHIEAPHTSAQMLQEYLRAFPNFLEAIRGASVLDFGCGSGDHSIALVEAGAREVVGLDIYPHKFSRNEELTRAGPLAGRLSFKAALTKDDDRRFDAVITMNAFEHFADPERELDNMLRVLKPGGRIFISFGPLWYSPFGVHNMFFIRIPWANILFAQQTIFNARKAFIDQEVTDYSELGLNKMTLRRFERMVFERRLRADYQRYACSFNLNAFRNVPVLRELFVNHITCVLRRGA